MDNEFKMTALMDRIVGLEMMTFLPAPRVPGDLTERLWRVEDQLESIGALHPWFIKHLPLPETVDPPKVDVIETRLEILEHLCATALKG
jgi:hypothetical protein